VYLFILAGLGLGLFTAPVVAVDSPMDRHIDRLLTRLESAAVDPLTLQSAVPAVPESVDELTTRRSMVLARAIQTLESSVDTTLAVLQGDVLTPLSLARNYRHLGMRRRALRWYEAALTADKHHEYTTTLRSEFSKCAVELGDSSTVVQAVRANLALADPDEVADATAQLLEFLLMGPAGREIHDLFDTVESASPSEPPRLRLALARFFELEGAPDRARRHYRELVRQADHLDLEMVARALKGLADTTVEAGDLSRGRSLYRSYQRRDAGRLSAWSTYRLGQLAVLDGDFVAATREFRSICEREDSTPWQDDACLQLEHARQLQEIDDALDPYGVNLNFKRRNSR
jgi:tetratricopeptide (TPR) repeat protein